MVVEWDTGTRVGMHWWEQVENDLVGGAGSGSGDGGSGWGRRVTKGSKRGLTERRKIMSTT